MILIYTNTITEYNTDKRTVQPNKVLVENETKGKALLENWNENARRNARNFNRFNPYRYDFVSSRPATKEEVETMDLYAPVESWQEMNDRKWAETATKTLTAH